MQNFTTYTEVDPNTHIAATTWRATGTGVIRNEECFFYKDLGAGYFVDFTHDYTCLMTDGTNNNGVLVPHAVATRTGSMIVAGGVGENWLGSFLIDLIVDKIYIRNQKNGVQVDSDNIAITQGVVYYIRAVRAGASYVTGIYTTEALRNAGDGTDGDHGNLSMTINAADTFRYSLAATSVGSAANPNETINGYVENINLFPFSGGDAQYYYYHNKKYPYTVNDFGKKGYPNPPQFDTVNDMTDEEVEEEIKKLESVVKWRKG